MYACMLFVCVCVYVFIYTHIYIYMCVYMYVCTYLFIYFIYQLSVLCNRRFISLRITVQVECVPTRPNVI